MITLSEDLLTMDAARELFPRGPGGKLVSRAAIYRYAATGVGGVRLEAIRFGGKLSTSRQAVERFVERLNAGVSRADTPDDPGAAARSPASRRRAVDAAERELARMGV